MELRVVLAGRVGVEVDGIAVDDPGLGSLGRITLAYLVLERHRPIPSDELAEVLWADSLPSTWRAALRGLVSKVRELLAAAGIDRSAAVASGPGWYQICLPAGTVVDIEAAAASLASAADSLAGNDLDSAQRAASEALAVAAQTFAVGGRGIWVERRQDEQRELHERALETLAQVHTVAGASVEAVALADEAVARQPLRESAHRCLMAAHSAGGNRGEALRAYERCRRILAEELGVRPSEQTEAAYLRLLGAEPAAPDAPGEAPGGPARPLPLPLTTLVGREREVVEAGQLLRRTRLLTLTGSSGVGKSRLALELARSIGGAGTGPGTAVLVELASLARGAESGRVAERFADALGFRLEGDDVSGDLAASLASREVLVVLDSCEHVVEAAAGVAEAVLRACPHVSILATSQVPLRLAGEAVWTVSPLPVPPVATATLAGAAAHPAARLLLDRVRARRPDVVLTDADAPAVVEICRCLDGLPLALELAAARTGALSLQDIAARLDDRFALLTVGARTAPPRHQSLTATLEWAWYGLGPASQRLLRRLAVFAADFALDAAGWVSGPPEAGDRVLDSLADLVERGLVQLAPVTGSSRYRLLESVRHFAAERLEEAGEAPAARERHLRWAVGLAEQAATELEGPHQRRWLELLAAEFGELVAALSWATSGGAREEGLRLAAALGRYWEVRGHVGEGRAWLARALAAAGPGPGARRASARVAAATLAQRQGDLPAARASHLEALHLARAGGDLVAEAAALHGLGLLDALAGDASSARSRYLNSLAIGRQLGRPSIVATALANLGWLSRNQADLSTARALLEESLGIQRSEGLTYGAAWSWYFLGRLAEAEGDLDRARGAHQEGLVLRHQLGDRPGEADSSAALGSVALHQGDRAAARRWAEQSLDLRRELGDRAGVLESLRLLGDVARMDGQDQRAEHCYQESLDLAVALDDRCCATRARVRLALLAGAAGHHGRARGLLRQCEVEGSRPDEVLAEWVEGVGALAVSSGRAELGARLLGAAAAVRSAIGVPIPPADGAGSRQCLARGRQLLGEQAWAEASAAGRSMALDDALASSWAELAA